MSTALDIDVAALVGEMEAPPCESLGHTTQLDVHDDGRATHYARVHCRQCGVDVVKAYCATFTSAMQADRFPVACFACMAGPQPSDHITVLGPVMS